MKKSMNTVSQTFNWSRFVATLRKEVLENKRTLIFSVISIYGLLAIFMILGNLMSYKPREAYIVIAGKTPQSVVFMLLSFGVCVMASMAFRNLKTKTGRTSLFTSPSSTLEKFLVNVLIYVVGFFVVFFVCAQLADLTRIAVLSPFKDDNFIVPGPINFLGCFSIFTTTNVHLMGLMPLITIFLIVQTVAHAALFLLGSVLWPRMSLIKTFVTIFVAQMIFGIIIFVLIAISGEPNALKEWIKNFVESGDLFRVLIAFWSIVTVASVAMTWYLFKRKDVVSLKWWK